MNNVEVADKSEFENLLHIWLVKLLNDLLGFEEHIQLFNYPYFERRISS